LPYLALLIANVIWGVNFLVAKITITEFPIMSLSFLRFAIAFLLLLPFLLFEWKSNKLRTRDLPKIFAVGITMITLNIALFYEGLVRTTITDASVLTLVIPAFSVLLGWYFLKEKVYIINIVGIVMGLLGAVLIIGVPLLFLGNVNGDRLLGNTLIVMSSLIWVVGMLWSKELLKRYSSLFLTASSFLIGAITFAPPAALEYLHNPHWIDQVSLLGLVGLGYIIILSSIVAYFFTEWGVEHLSVSQASFFQYIEPLIATTLGVFILSERISYSLIVGAIMIGLGVYWGTLGKERHHRIIRHHRR
jgi:drug/metabolite transporter (DMT)-like permease